MRIARAVGLSCIALLVLAGGGTASAQSSADEPKTLEAGFASPLVLQAKGSSEWSLDQLAAGAIVEVQVDIPKPDLNESDVVEITIVCRSDGPSKGAGQRDLTKTLNAGDPGLFIPIRVSGGGKLTVRAHSTSERELPIRVKIRELVPQKQLGDDERLAFEAEPNNSFREATPIRIGRSVYGNNDDTDYLDNKFEKPEKNFANGLDNPVRDRPGLDWFRLDYEKDGPELVIFELDVLDRDVSVNLRTYVMNKERTDVELFTGGSDPMEIIHDREPERYSKSITRVLTRGTYYLQVNGNHPRYILRSKAYPVPPYANAEDAVRVGAHYIMNVGDAWVAQVPREGNIYRRVQNMHDTSLRCTACHPSIFSTEAVLTAKKAGYAIEAKSNLRYVVDRIYNGPTPMYGPFNVNWQRYIAIPMQSQGKHGGILIDFEKNVSGRETPTFLRYAPFLRKAWTGMEKLHDDEANGVVPADSNVGFAVRDWKVLTEAYRRTGEASYRDVAESVRSLVTGQKCDQKNIQDKLHRIWGLAIMRRVPEEFGDELKAAIAEMMSYQNADGGWPDIIEPGRASAVYTTGQTVWTLVQAGQTLESLPKLNDAIKYILSQQQSFGGWFQTTTHENFRTPMRETRYAVMALAATHPIKDGPAKGWGNRDGGEGRVPRTDSLLHTLDDLDNLWEVPAGREEEFTTAITGLLRSDEPLVRSLAAETVGRIGTQAAIEPLSKLLGDPVKDVWRSAAWALRQFGNRGQGIKSIQAALRSSDSSTRRGAARIFAYHYFGMDERLDLAHDLMKLTKDENFWTRLESLKSLRQWFYRSGENAFKREIVDLYIDHMGQPEHPAIRTNLAQGMYIMLDENEAGGVSLERNIARFPNERDREEVVAARRHVEQSVLLEPILEAMTSGNQLQRETLLASFDGSFFAGRYYARNPRDMIDVGNDREFSFYYQPPEPLLDRAFQTLLASPLAPERRAQALELASFFYVPRETSSEPLQLAFLNALHDPEAAVREAALKMTRDDLALKGSEHDAKIGEQVMALLKDENSEIRLAALAAVKRNPAWLHEPRVMEMAKGAIAKGADRAMLLSFIDTDLMDAAAATQLLQDSWLEVADENERIRLVDRLFARREMIDTENPERELVQVLRTISVDPSTSVREKLLDNLEKNKKLSRSARIASVLHSGLSDGSPKIRLRSLKLAQVNGEFWKDADTVEYTLRLLIDPDPKIRSTALGAVEKFNLMKEEKRFAPRVKALAADKVLGGKATALLTSNGYDPAKVEADGAIQSFGIPDLEFFREKVNPYFYKEGADGHSCYDCHQNHNILRIGAKPAGGGAMPESLIIDNLNSALKVVNLGDPEQSLILRKPRSPRGQGSASPDSPTGLTHVGGPRWEATTDPAYQTMLAWIRDAASSNKRRLGVAAAVDSYSPEYPAKYALDGDPQTIWHTEFVGASPPFPHEIVIDLGESAATSAFQYVPRQDSSNGRVKEWELYVSADGVKWDDKVASGEWPDDAAVKTVPLNAKGVRFVKLRGLSSVNGLPLMSAAEVIVLRANDARQTAAGR